MDDALLKIALVINERYKGVKQKLVAKYKNDEMFNFLISANVVQAFKAYTPVFNEIKVDKTIYEYIGLWFYGRQTHTAWTSLPYLIQRMLHVTTVPIGLSYYEVHNILGDALIDPFAKLPVIESPHTEAGCKMCGKDINKDVCISCVRSLLPFTEYRYNDFTVNLTHRNYPLRNLILGKEIFTVLYNNYTISRTDKYTFDFKFTPTEKVQLLLPFAEFQKSLS